MQMIERIASTFLVSGCLLAVTGFVLLGLHILMETWK